MTPPASQDNRRTAGTSNPGPQSRTGLFAGQAVTATPGRCIAPDIYSHVMPAAQEEAAERLDEGLRKALAR